MIDWLENNVPQSTRFNDTYFTKSDGRAEVDHVFINGNNLIERWAICPSMTIGELGFGTGLNFLQTVYRLPATFTPEKSLHFISFEQYPLNKNQIQRALSTWPELGSVSRKLVELWEFDQSRLELQFTPQIKLSVIFGDANQTLPKISKPIDAWYLDGFAPSKNSQLWNLELMNHVFANTKTGGTFATYSVAGMVRRNLSQAGFTIERQKGFGSKREMLVGKRE